MGAVRAARRAEARVDHVVGPGPELLERRIGVPPRGQDRWAIPGTPQVRQEVVVEFLDGSILPIAGLVVGSRRHEEVRIAEGHAERVQRVGCEGGPTAVHPRDAGHGRRSTVGHGARYWGSPANRASPLCVRII